MKTAIQPTIPNMKRKATELGAIVSEGTSEGRSKAIYIDLPAGRIFKANLCHGIVCSWFVGHADWKRDAITDTLELLAMGVEDGCSCDHPGDCDTCNPEEN